MEKRSNLEEKEKNARAARERIMKQIQELTQREADLQIRVNQEIVATGESKSLDDLVDAKTRRQALQTSLEFSTGEILKAAQELESFDLAQAGGRVFALDESCALKAVEIRKQIGVLQGLLLELKALTGEIQRAPERARPQDIQIRERFFVDLVYELGQQLEAGAIRIDQYSLGVAYTARR